MKDQLISFDTAALAKEKGFNESTAANYWKLAKDKGNNDKIFLACDHVELEDIIRIDEGREHNVYHVLRVPTQSLLQKWLREKYLIHVYTKYIPYDSKPWSIYIDSLSSQNNGMQLAIIPLIFQSYEEAIECGLYEALKLCGNILLKSEPMVGPNDATHYLHFKYNHEENKE